MKLAGKIFGDVFHALGIILWTIFVAHPLLILVVVALGVALFLRMTLFHSDQTRQMKWRVKFRLRPGQGFATIWELWWHWSKLAALHHGKRMRPTMGLFSRLARPATEYARRLGRAQYGKRVFARGEDQTLMYAPPRVGKTGQAGDWVLDHPGAALVTESRPDILFGSIAERLRMGRCDVFNPQRVAGIPSTFRFPIIVGCHDPSEALYRAVDLAGAAAAASTGEMQWWVEKAGGCLAAAMHAAALVGGTMDDVWDWSNGQGAQLIHEAVRHPQAARELFGMLTELDRPGKTSDSIRITMTKAIGWMAVREIRAIVTGQPGDGFDVRRWIDGRGTVYLLAPGGEAAPTAPLFRCLAGHMHRQAKTYGQLMPWRKCDPPPLFLLDELHLCPVDLPHMLADSAGFGIQIVAVVHSSGQLKDKYGDAGLDTVWSTTGTKVFMPGIQNVHTLREVSQMLGRRHKAEVQEALNVPLDFLRELPDGRALVVRMNRPPVVVKFRPHWKRPGYRLRKWTGTRPPLPDWINETALREALEADEYTPPVTVPETPVPAGWSSRGAGNGSGNGQQQPPGWPAPAPTAPLHVVPRPADPVDDE